MNECKPLTRGSPPLMPLLMLPRPPKPWTPTTAARGRAVQVDPIKPALKPSGKERLKLIYDGLLSNFAFKFNLRRYIVGTLRDTRAGAYTRPLFSST